MTTRSCCWRQPRAAGWKTASGSASSGAPTCYGVLSMTMESHAAAGRIVAEVVMPARRQPKELLIRFRHPEQRRIQSTTVNGTAWTDFDRDKEWIRIPAPEAKRYMVEARY